MNRLSKTAVIYAVSAAAAYGFDKIYSLFGHGVRSAWMSNMYLAPLVLGVLLFLLLRMLAPGIVMWTGYRLFVNIYGSGVAILVNAMMLRGIIEIAGGTSGLVIWFFNISYVFLGIGIVMLIGEIPNLRKNTNYGK